MSSQKEKVSEDAGDEFVRCYYVRVTLTGKDGTERRGTVEVDGRLLRALADHEGSGRAARSWVRKLVAKMCRDHPQDLGLGSARWKKNMGMSMNDYIEQAIRKRTKWRDATVSSVTDEVLCNATDGADADQGIPA